jgi:hypothetical protein
MLTLNERWMINIFNNFHFSQKGWDVLGKVIIGHWTPHLSTCLKKEALDGDLEALDENARR